MCIFCEKGQGHSVWLMMSGTQFLMYLFTQKGLSETMDKKHLGQRGGKVLGANESQFFKPQMIPFLMNQCISRFITQYAGHFLEDSLNSPAKQISLRCVRFAYQNSSVDKFGLVAGGFTFRLGRRL